MAGSKDRSGSKPEASGGDFDGVWEAIADGTSKAPDGATKLWDDESRGARKRDGDPEPEPEPAPKSERTVAWTEEVRGARKNDHAEEPDDKMARLMAEAAAAPQAEDDEEAPLPASASMVGAAFVDMRPAAEPASDAMARLMGLPEGEDDAEGGAAREAGEVPDDSDKADDAETSASASVAAPIPLRPRASELAGDEPDLAVPETETVVESGDAAAQDAAEGGRAWMWIAAAVVVGGVGFAVMQGDDATPEPPPPTVARAAVDDPAVAVAASGGNTPRPRADGGEGPQAREDGAALANQVGHGESADDAPTEASGGSDAKPARSSDPREAPPGTPPEIVEVFEKIPVSAADQPPVGGIGATGVHIDAIEMGTGYARSRCEGESTRFSVADAGQANVCLRVVHQRQKEELVIVWQKKGGHARRGKIVVKAAHAYRTRAYLKLRSEYVGEWDVKILSGDGVELASQSFTIVP